MPLRVTPWLSSFRSAIGHLARKSDDEIIREGMPVEFRQELDLIEEWGESNDKEARQDKLAFWGLKLPAIIVSASGATLAHFKLDDYAMIAGTVATLCVLIDGLRPRGLLYSAHLRTSQDIFKLHADMISDWRRGMLKGLEPKALAAQIMADSVAERTRISNFISKIETASIQERPPMA